MKRETGNPAVLRLPESPVVFYLPYSRLPLSMYAELTGQPIRTVQQQANTGKLTLTRAQPGRERQVNMVYEFLEAFYEAQEALKARA